MLEFLQKHPGIIVGTLVFIAIGVLAYLLILGARNQRLADAIYDGDDFGFNHPIDDCAHPLRAKWRASDQEGCRHCGQAWDMNELYPPICTKATTPYIPQPRNT